MGASGSHVGLVVNGRGRWEVGSGGVVAVVGGRCCRCSRSWRRSPVSGGGREGSQGGKGVLGGEGRPGSGSYVLAVGV